MFKEYGEFYTELAFVHKFNIKTNFQWLSETNTYTNNVEELFIFNIGKT